MAQKVPLVDLHAQYRAIQPAIDSAIQSVIERTAFIMGPDVRSFEDEFARFCTSTHAVGVASGTAALELTLRACGIGRGLRDLHVEERARDDRLAADRAAEGD